MCAPGFSGIDCSIVWIIWIMIFFAGAMLRKQINDNLSVSFSLIGATVVGIILQIVVLYIPWIGGVKWSILGAIVGILIGGFGGGMVGMPDAETTE